MAINRDKVLEAAQKYVEKKKYDKAIEEYRKLVQVDPNDARTHLKIGDLQVKQGQHEAAISTYETVGKLYSQQGFALKAIAVYKQIREIVAKHVPHAEERYGHITPKLAELYQQLGLTSDALSALDEVATRLQRQQRDGEAIEVFRKIVELDPTNPLPHLRLAEAFSRIKDNEGAVQEFKTAAQQLASIGRRDDAIKVLERLLHHKPDIEQARVCAELYLARGQQQDGMQALSKLQLCFQANPRDFDTLSLLARAFNAIGQGAKAIEVQKEMARVARDSGKADLFREIVERLLRVAPHDDGVKKLAGQAGGGYAAPEPPAPEPPPPPPPPAPSAPQMGGHMGGQMGSGQYPQAPSGSYPQTPYGQPQYPQAPQPPYGHAQPAPYGQAQPAPYGQQPGYGQQPPYGQHIPPQPPPVAYGQAPAPPPFASRPGLERPATGGVAPPPIPPSAHALPTHEISEEEAEELSYEEVEADEIEADGAAAEEAYEEEAPQPQYHGGGAAYLDQQYGDVADAADGSDGMYTEPRAYQQQDEQPEYAGEAPQTEITDDAGDLGEQIAKILDDAASFRRVRLYNKALDTLRIGLELDPRSMDLHEVYRDVLIEAGQTEEAVQEMLAIAALYVDALDGDSAARALQDVLAFDPQNARAIEMLQELGYEIVDENEPAGDVQAEVSTDVEGQAYEAGEPAHERLPSYDLEEMRAHDVSPEYADERQVVVSRSQAPGELEDGSALPSFPLDEPAEEITYDEDGGYVPAEEQVAAAEEEAAVAHAHAHAAMPSAAPTGGPSRSPGAPPAMELEDALDEAEFFCSRGLFDDARQILVEQLGAHPNNPLLRERLAEIDAQEQQRGSGAREKPREQDRSFDIAASLDALESLDYGEAQQASGFSEPDQQVDVEEVFAKFKEGVAKQISVDDSDSHYNLGIAYKEMMLTDDAIREFEIAAQDPKRECVCRSMIGMIEIERGRLNEAIEAFLQGLNAPVKDSQQETMLCYEIGSAYEAKKMLKDALSYFQKAMRRDPNYRDVQERVRRLAKNEPKQPVKAAVGADDEFDRAFDDLLGKP